MTLPPGATIGIIGAGQLGRMLAIAAAQLGYRTHILAPQSGPANDVSPEFTRAAYDDADALARFAGVVDVVTYEFENIEPAPVAALIDQVPVHPAPRALAIAQDRIAEKSFVGDLGGRTARWAAVETRDALDQAVASVGLPAILKTNRFGYDGKGQVRLHDAADVAGAWEAIGGGPAILEGFVAFDHEFSVIIARGNDGAHVVYDTPLNEHADGILARSTLPAPAAVTEQAAEAVALTRRIADALDYVGVLTCEFFAGADGPVFNEMAPRVHNSGHWTIEGAQVSQFQNHIRAICGLPLGDPSLVVPRVEMHNLIGDQVNAWPQLMATPGVSVHLYGKHNARPGRKMGHTTRLG